MFKSFHNVARKCKRAIKQRIALSTLKRQSEKEREAGPIRVIFLVQYIPAWNKVESLYRLLNQDKRFEVYLVCVPNDISMKTPSNEISVANEVFKWYKDNGYDAIDAVNGGLGWIDLERYRPDYVFSLRPYNHFMPPEYSSKVIARYAKVCALLYAICFEYNTMPVEINDDYFNYVSYFFAECNSTKDYFDKSHYLGRQKKYQESFTVGMPIVDYLSSRESTTMTSHQENTRPLILWTPRWSTDSVVGGSHFFELKNLFIWLASEYPEADFIIRPHPLMFNNFLATGQMTLEEVCAFKAFCSERANVTLDENEDYIDILCAADLMISDMSAILLERYTTGKPTILWEFIGPEYTQEYEIMKQSFSVVTSTEEVSKLVCSFIDDFPRSACNSNYTDFSGIFGEAYGKSLDTIRDILLLKCKN